MSRRLAAVCIAFLWVGCVGSGESPKAPDAGFHADAGFVVPVDAFRADAGQGCSSGQHLCGTTCTPDQPNNPSNGCKHGCGGVGCAVPDHGVGQCTAAGECDFTCESPFERVGEFCECAALTCEMLGATCGTPDDGCGSPLACGECPEGATCILGACACGPDPGEPNESNATVRNLGRNFSDRPDSSQTYNTFALGSASDIDWFVARVDDTCCDGSPIVRVSVDNIPTGSDFELGAWYQCDSHGDDSNCSTGDSDTSYGRGCLSSHPGNTGERIEIETSCSGADEDGLLLIRVTSAEWASSCTPYRLRIEVQ